MSPYSRLLISGVLTLLGGTVEAGAPLHPDPRAVDGHRRRRARPSHGLPRPARSGAAERPPEPPGRARPAPVDDLVRRAERDAAARPANGCTGDRLDRRAGKGRVAGLQHVDAGRPHRRGARPRGSRGRPAPGSRGDPRRLGGDRRGRARIRREQDAEPVIPPSAESGSHVLRAGPGLGLQPPRAFRPEERHRDPLLGRDPDGARSPGPGPSRSDRARAGEHPGASPPRLLPEDPGRPLLRPLRRHPLQSSADDLVQLDGLLRRREGGGHRQERGLDRRQPRGLRLRLRPGRRRL